MLENFKHLQKKIGIEFSDQAILEQALTHRSFINEAKKDNRIHNERLEFLGDAVLELVVTEYLFNKYPEFNEGKLTSLRSALVRTESLAFEALKVSLGEYLFMSHGEESSGGRTRPYILANAFESLIGAIYQDQGYNTAKGFIVKHLCYKAKEIIDKQLDIDPKSKLQEIVQEKMKQTPSYQVINETGPDHNKIFTMGVAIGSVVIAKGKGESKQLAEQQAASRALQNWDKIIKEKFEE